MRQYRPDVERQKLLYSRMKSRALLRRLQGKPPVNTAIAEGRKQIPDNSVPRPQGEVTCVADAMCISDRIQELPFAPSHQAAETLQRFPSPKVAEAALAHPEESVRQLGLRYLHELAEDGDPFAADILKNLPR
jgi:hypothetical protein